LSYQVSDFRCQFHEDKKLKVERGTWKVGSVKQFLILTVIFFFTSTALVPPALARRQEMLSTPSNMRRELHLRRVTPRRFQDLHRPTPRQLRATRRTKRLRSGGRVPSATSVPSVPSAKTQPNQKFTPSTPLPDLSSTSHFLLLGEKGPVIATIKVTPQDEPVHVRAVQVTLSAEVLSLSSLEIFDDVGYVLGHATFDLAASAARTVFTLALSPENAYFIGKKETAILAVRPLLREEDLGGVSGEVMLVTSITPTAMGVWTSKSSTVKTSGLDFQQHQIANAVLDTVQRSGKEMGTFTVGIQKAIGTFFFAATQNADGNPALQTLTFSVAAPTEVTLSNVVIRAKDSDASHACSTASSTITCSSIPSGIGSLQSPRTITIYADVALTSSHPDPFLQLEFNNPGRPGSAGDITWTDGTTSVTWVPFNAPVAQGTLWK
jgi:hypothetical protein